MSHAMILDSCSAVASVTDTLNLCVLYDMLDISRASIRLLLYVSTTLCVFFFHVHSCYVCVCERERGDHVSSRPYLVICQLVQRGV